MVHTRSALRRLSTVLKNELIDDVSNKVLSMQISDSLTAFINYEKTKDGTYHLIHSEVPQEVQGLGYGHILVKETFDYIAANNYKMSISCRFIKRVYEEHKHDYKQYYVETK